MDAYYGGLKIYEVISYSGFAIPESLKDIIGDQYVVVRFGSENGTPIIVQTDDIEIR